MRIISSREFNDNQKLYFDLADQNEQIIVQRGKDITESDRLSTNPALINKIKDAERAIREGKTTKINDIDNIWESIL